MHLRSGYLRTINEALAAVRLDCFPSIFMVTQSNCLFLLQRNSISVLVAAPGLIEFHCVCVQFIGYYQVIMFSLHLFCIHSLKAPVGFLQSTLNLSPNFTDCYSSKIGPLFFCFPSDSYLNLYPIV